MLTPLLLLAGMGGVWLWRKKAPRLIALPKGTLPQVMEFSPDGKRLIILLENITTIPSQQQLQIYDIGTRSKVGDLVIPSWPVTAPNPRFLTTSPRFAWPSWSPDGTQIVAGYTDESKGTTLIPSPYYQYNKKTPRLIYNSVGKIALWDARTGTLNGNWLYAPPSVDSVSKVRFSRDGHTLVGYGKPLATFTVATGRRFPASKKDTPEEELGVTVVDNSASKQLRVIDTRTRRALWQPDIKRSTYFDYQWYGEVLGVSDVVEEIDPKTHAKKRRTRWHLWSARTRSQFSIPSSSVQSQGELRMSPDKKTFAAFVYQSTPKDKAADIKGEFVLWDYQQNRILARVPAQSHWSWIQWSPNGKWVSAMTTSTATSSTPTTERRLLIFDQNGKLRFELPCTGSESRWTPDSTHIAYQPKTNPGTIEILRVAD